MPDSWIERVKQADAEAEHCWNVSREFLLEHGVVAKGCAESVAALFVYTVAAELRAQRIARRPGAGQS